MKSKFTLEFSGGRMQTTFPSSADNGVRGPSTLYKDRANYIVYDSPRLCVAAPKEGSPKGSDRAVCRTVNGFVKVKLLNNAILDDFKYADSGFVFNTLFPIVSAALCGESSGQIGVLDYQQYYPRIQGVAGLTTTMYESSGELGFRVFGSYANLMENIFIRVTIQRGPAIWIGSLNNKLKIDAVCSGALIGGDLR